MEPSGHQHRPNISHNWSLKDLQQKQGSPDRHLWAKVSSRDTDKPVQPCWLLISLGSPAHWGKAELATEVKASSRAFLQTDFLRWFLATLPVGWRVWSQEQKPHGTVSVGEQTSVPMSPVKVKGRDARIF